MEVMELLKRLQLLGLGLEVRGSIKVEYGLVKDIQFSSCTKVSLSLSSSIASSFEAFEGGSCVERFGINIGRSVSQQV